MTDSVRKSRERKKKQGAALWKNVGLKNPSLPDSRLSITIRAGGTETISSIEIEISAGVLAALTPEAVIV